MTLLVLSWVALGCAAVPALMYLWNSFLFRAPPTLQDPPPPAPLPSGSGEVDPSRAANVNEAPTSSSPLPSGGGAGGVGFFGGISVLIPARNEEAGIAACVRSVLASTNVELEVIVLDDASTDRTAEVVRALAAEDARVRVEPAPPLPPGWCGKQHACFALSRFARYDTLTFLDADVRLAPDALARMALFQRATGAELVSGFPHQETGTLLEKLLIPLIHWLLLCWLPLWAMRRFRWSAFGAGCGQFFLTTSAAYERVGGHGAIRTSLHDGLTLPRAYRRAGFRTDVCDATDLATCRMYNSARSVWNGLAKNAREGLAATGQIGFWTVVLLFGQVLPLPLLVLGYARPQVLWCALVALVLSFAVRAAMTGRFAQSILGEVLHPVAILLLLAVQWYALLRAAIGRPVGWKGRAAPRPEGTP